jgi:tetratricopeptide (TPR) repeat protein
MFRLGRWTLVLQFCALALIATAAFSSDTISIQGEIVSESGQRPHEPIVVQLLNGGSAIQEGMADTSGRFKFSKVTPGAYVVRVQRDGYEPQDVPVSASASTPHLRITLKAKPPVQSAFSTPFDPFAGLDIPKAAKKEFELGNRELKALNCQTAIVHFQKAVSLYPRYGDAFLEIGNCNRKLGNAAGSEEALKKAMAYSPTVYPTLSLAGLYIDQKRYDEAEKLIQPLIAQHPEEGDLYGLLARIYFELGRMHEAELAGLEAHARHHESADVHLILAKIYESRHNRSAQITQLNDYLDENPGGSAAQEVRKQLTQLTGAP